MAKLGGPDNKRIEPSQEQPANLEGASMPPNFRARVLTGPLSENFQTEPGSEMRAFLDDPNPATVNVRELVRAPEAGDGRPGLTVIAPNGDRTQPTRGDLQTAEIV
ncbi:MAG: hypothetical protein D6719_09070 [Candidatus Dadabacteria bacterium]|nr:MAG: hypothetical protein D6719_09070 [Candidatus Dadabacteria bacterium]